MKFISLGEINKKYIFILLVAVFRILRTFIYDRISYRNSFIPLRIFQTETQINLSNHRLIHGFYRFCGIFIISLIIYRIKKGTFFLSIFNKKGNLNIDQRISRLSDTSKISCFSVLMVIILWVIAEPIISEYRINITDLELWMIELLFLCYLNHKIFSQQIYIHHKISITLSLSLCLLKIYLIALSLIDQDENGIFYSEHKWTIPVGIIIYLIIIIIISFVNIELKTFMDYKYISPSEILIIYGFIGTIFFSILCIISTNIACPSFFKDNICNVEYKTIKNNEELPKYYFDNFFAYYEVLKGKGNNNKEIINEIVKIILGNIANIIYKYCFLLVINYLSPVHTIISYSLVKLFPKIILPINNLILEGTFFKKDSIKNIGIKYSFGIILNILAIIGFAIYLELIELNFWGLNFYLKKYSLKRAEDEETECDEDINDLLNDKKNNSELETFKYKIGSINDY